MDQEQRYVDFFYHKYQGRVAIGVGFNPNFSEIYPLVFQAKEGQLLGVVALGVIPNGACDAVHIYHIGAFNTGMGNGSTILEELCLKADQFKIILSVSAIGLPNGQEPRISDDTLDHWYRTYRFKGDTQLLRQPASPLTQG
ncbi:MAG: hypothetical protein V1793_17765 [Pseudomonadota bacterium]